MLACTGIVDVLIGIRPNAVHLLRGRLLRRQLVDCMALWIGPEPVAQLADSCVSLCRRSREGGNPASFHARRWAPAFAGATKIVK